MAESFFVFYNAEVGRWPLRIAYDTSRHSLLIQILLKIDKNAADLLRHA